MSNMSNSRYLRDFLVPEFFSAVSDGSPCSELMPPDPWPPDPSFWLDGDDFFSSL